MGQRLIDPNEVIAPLNEEYKKIKQAFDETSVFEATNDVALYGALMQELGAVIGMIEDAKTVDAEPVIRCKDCRFFETNHWEKVNKMPLIVAHEICTRWGKGCKTAEDGFCFMAERKEE